MAFDMCIWLLHLLFDRLHKMPIVYTMQLHWRGAIGGTDLDNVVNIFIDRNCLSPPLSLRLTLPPTPSLSFSSFLSQHEKPRKYVHKHICIGLVVNSFGYCSIGENIQFAYKCTSWHSPSNVGGPTSWFHHQHIRMISEITSHCRCNAFDHSCWCCMSAPWCNCKLFWKIKPNNL